MQAFELREGLRDFYKQEYAEYSNVEITDVEKMAENWESIIYSYTLNYSTNERTVAKRMLIKLYPGREGKDKANKEFNLMASLMMTTIQIPDPYRIELETVFDLPFIIIEYIKGDLMSKRIIEQPEKQDHYVNHFSRLLVDVHTVDWETMILESELYKVADSSYHYLAKLLMNYKDQIEMHHKLEFLPVLRWLVERMDRVSDVKLSLIHGDFHLANVLIDDNDETFVIDWINATIGDFRVDLGWTLIVHETNLGKPIRDRILNTYREYASYEVSDIKYFEVLAILRQILNLSINFSYESEIAKLNPVEADAMRNSLIPIKRALGILYGHTSIKLTDFQKMLG